MISLALCALKRPTHVHFPATCFGALISGHCVFDQPRDGALAIKLTDDVCARLTLRDHAIGNLLNFFRRNVFAVVHIHVATYVSCVLLWRAFGHELRRACQPSINH